MLDEQLAKNETTEENSEQTENGDAEPQSVENDGNDEVEENANNAAENTEDQTTGEATSNLPFLERLISQGYHIKVLPNGFPFDVPYH